MAVPAAAATAPTTARARRMRIRVNMAAMMRPARALAGPPRWVRLTPAARGRRCALEGVAARGARRQMIVAGRLRPVPTWAAPAAHEPMPALPAGAALLALAVAVAALRSHALDAPLWMDEGISIGIASHPLGAIPSVLSHDGSPPLYYLLLNLWMSVFGSSPTATHALSLTFFALAVPAA